MSHELAALFAKRFIQRRDVKAVQFSNGNWSPDTQLKNRTTQQPDPGRYGPIGFQMDHLHQHLAGTHTYGHYLLDDQSLCRMFAFDIDLRKDLGKVDGQVKPCIFPTFGEDGQASLWSVPDMREAWLDRSHMSRDWNKMQMGMLARKLISAIIAETGLPCAAAYSGSKGVHVYGFTGPMPAEQVRAAATYVLESLDDWVVEKGHHLYKHKLEDPIMGYPNFSIEVFPKQDSLEGKDLGNLMRLPLGRNLKSQDPTFFLDLTTPIGVMAPHPNPVQLLEVGNPYEL